MGHINKQTIREGLHCLFLHALFIHVIEEI